MYSKLIHVAAVCVLPLWWIFWILWTPGIVHSLASLSYRFSTSVPDEAIAAPARTRALAYATRGSSVKEDIYFTRDEIAHLVDVSGIYSGVDRLLGVLATCAWMILIFSIIQKEDIRAAAHIGSLILGGLTFLSILCVVFFSFFFTTFHYVLFPQGNWMFPAESLLIQIFPETFWKILLLLIIGLLSLSSLVLYLIGKKR